MPRPASAAVRELENRIRFVAEVIDDMQGQDIVVLRLGEICDFCDAFVIATTRSSTHMNAIHRRLIEKLRAEGLRPLNKEATGDQRWSLIDYGDVVVHLFSQEARRYYDLEGLWGDAERQSWPVAAASSGGAG